MQERVRAQAGLRSYLETVSHDGANAESNSLQDAVSDSSDASAPRPAAPAVAPRPDAAKGFDVALHSPSETRVASLAVPYITTISSSPPAPLTSPSLEPPFFEVEDAQGVPPTVRTSRRESTVEAARNGVADAPGPRSRRGRLAVALATLSLMLVTSLVGVFGYGFYRYRSLLEVTPVAEEADEPKTRRAVEREEEDDERVDGASPEPSPDVPRRTEMLREGVLSVVDVGLDAPPLDQVLREQREIAEEEGQTVLVMLTGQRCEPCRGFDDALADPRMQTALASVRLVRVDLNVFAEEVERMAFPSRLYPSFLLLGPDLRPVDAIHGGEWDADIAENIAPILGSFVQGTYLERRHPDFPRTTTATPM